MDSTKIARKIQEVIDSKPREFTKEQAEKILRDHGIIDKDGEITEAFKGIVVRKKTR